MAERYLFFNAIETSPGVYDREYQSQDFADYFGSVLSTGLLHTNNSPGLHVTVEPETMNTVVDVGRAIMRGHFYENTTPLTLTHSIPEPILARIDRVVLRLNLYNAERNIKLQVVSGEPSENPNAPELVRNQFIYDISLAQVYIRANTVQLRQQDITDERLDEDVCGVASSLISVPTNVFDQQWQQWLNDRDSSFENWFADNQQEFMDWFESIRDILDENVAGNLLLLIKQNQDNIRALNKIKTDITVLASGWKLNAETDLYEYVINDANITVDSMVDVNIQLEYLDFADYVMSACVSSDGYVTLYAEGEVENNIIVDYRITRQVG